MKLPFDSKPPTGHQCDNNAVLHKEGSSVFMALWYPQMGGYIGKAIAQVYGDNSCVNVWVWHDGEFPFVEGDPRHIHHCDEDQFVKFASDIKKARLEAVK